MRPSASFVIINKDDRGLEDTLRALADADVSMLASAETVVVDASQGRLDDIRDRCPEVRWLPFEPDASKPTIPEQRNAGIEASTGDIVVFIDASCVPAPDWVPRLLAPIVHEAEAVVAGGTHSIGAATLRDETAHFRGDGPYIEEAPTINLAVRRELFDTVGMFDGAFHYGSDVDFTWRVVDHGFRIRYVPEAVVSHDWGDSRSEVRRSYLYGQARYRLYAKHRSRLRSLPQRDPTAFVYPLFLLMLPLTLFRPWIPGLLLVPMAKNVRHRPLLTVIDHVVYGAGMLTAAGRSVVAA